MKKVIFAKNINYLWLVRMLAFALMTIVAIGGGCSGGGGDADEDGSDSIGQTPGALTSYSEKEITSDGGSIIIIDENNNTIEVTFPIDALSGTTLISVGVLPEQLHLPIETRHVSAFEIKPFDAELYKPVWIHVTYANAVQDVKKTALYRVKTDELLIPLAKHEYLQFGTENDNKNVRAEAYFLGVFAEGKMSLDQINHQIDLLIASKDIVWNKAILAEVNDQTCYTNITKAIWDDWKETADGMWDYFVKGQLLGLYDENVDGFFEDLYDICTNVAGEGAQLVLDRCIPEDLCDHNYRYTIIDALDTIQRLGCMLDNDIYTQMVSRFNDMATKCIKYGTLVIHLSGAEIFDQFAGPETPYHQEIYMEADGPVPLKMEVVNISGFTEISDERGGTFALTGSGVKNFFPGTPLEKKCQIAVSGYIILQVAGSKDSSDVYSLSVVTHHYEGFTLNCPSEPTITTPLSHTKSRFFKVLLSAENGYHREAVMSEGDPQWNISVDLLLPQPAQ